MRTKVEELREIIKAIVIQCDSDLPYQTGLMAEVDSLIAAAKKEERERIRQASERVETLSEAYHAVECHFPPITPLFIVPELMLMLSEEEYPSLEKWVEGQGYGVKL